MFFKNIESWSKKKLTLFTIILDLLYLGLTLVAPLIIIANKYHLFKDQEAGHVISGFGIIVIAVFAILGLRSFKKVALKLPDNTLKQQRLKFSLLFIYAIAIPLLCLVALICFKTDFDLAYDTFKWCLGFFVGGIVVDYFFIKYIDKERDIRHAAEFDNEKDKRRFNGVI